MCLQTHSRQENMPTIPLPFPISLKEVESLLNCVSHPIQTMVMYMLSKQSLNDDYEIQHVLSPNGLTPVKTWEWGIYQHRSQHNNDTDLSSPHYLECSYGKYLLIVQTGKQNLLVLNTETRGLHVQQHYFSYSNSIENQTFGAITSSRNQKYQPQYFILEIDIHILFVVDTILQVSTQQQIIGQDLP